jgi:hypothetical protein
MANLFHRQRSMLEKTEISPKQKGRPQGRPTFFAPDSSGSSHQISFGWVLYIVRVHLTVPNGVGARFISLLRDL